MRYVARVKQPLIIFIHDYNKSLTDTITHDGSDASPCKIRGELMCCVVSAVGNASFTRAK